MATLAVRFCTLPPVLAILFPMQKSVIRGALALAAAGALFSSCRKDGASFANQPLDAASRAETEAALRAQAQNAAIAAYVASLSDAERISQLFLVNVDGNETYAPLEKTGALYGERGTGTALVPGGCLLFSYNIADSAEKIAAFTASIQRFYREHGMVPPYVAIDQEGGDVNRLRKITSTLVSQKKTVEWFSPEEAHAIYAAQARQLRALGIQMNLAPVVEAETDANRAFLETRTFGSLSAVLAYGDAAVRAYEDNGVAVVLKHFPGNSSTDPHSGLPHITFDAASDWDTYFKPFETLLPLASAVLMSHAVMQPAALTAGQGGISPAIPREEMEKPACFSRYWVTDVARTQFGFDGVIFSDDIFMGALANNGYVPAVAAVAALEAGVNCIMLSEKTFGAVAGWLLTKATEDAHFAALVDESVRRVIAFKVKLGLLELVRTDGETDAAASASAGADGSATVVASVYTVVARPADGAFDAAAFKAAYDDGMAFYQ